MMKAAGATPTTIQFICQSSTRKNIRVTRAGPRFHTSMIPEEQRSLLEGPVTYPKIMRLRLRHESEPPPLQNMPRATRYRFPPLKATRTVPARQIAHETRNAFLLPALSMRYEMMRQPVKAPRQVALLTRSMVADLSQRSLSSLVAIESTFSSDTQLTHWSSGSSQTYYEHCESVRARPLALQSNSLSRKRKAVLRRTTAVENQMSPKRITRRTWYRPVSPTNSMRLKQVVGRLC